MASPQDLAKRLAELRNLTAIRAAEADLAEQNARIRAAKQYMCVPPPLPPQPPLPCKAVPAKAKSRKAAASAAGAGSSGPKPKQPPKCRYGLRCRKLDEGCPFSHPPKAAAAAGAGSEEPVKTKKCRYGRGCRYLGKGCRFSHPPPAAAAGAGSSGPVKPKKCRYGRGCHNGWNCEIVEHTHPPHGGLPKDCLTCEQYKKQLKVARDAECAQSFAPH